MVIKADSKYKLKKLIQKLDSIRGRGTELITVYCPHDYDLREIVNQLREEEAEAGNIKSKRTRKNVKSALSKMIDHLKEFPRTPDNGVAVFCGNVADEEGKTDIHLWDIEPPQPIEIKLYRCGKEFRLGPLKEMLEEGEEYGLVVMDTSKADLGILKGKKIVPKQHISSLVPGKSKPGGQCLTPESLVQTSDGNIVEIKDCHNPLKLKAIDLNGRVVENTNITDKWSTKKEVTYRITTKMPRMEVNCSKDHLLFVYENDQLTEKPAEKLEKGDILIFPEQINTNGEKQRLDSYRYYRSYSISDEGRELLKEKRSQKNLSQKEFGKRIDIHQAAVSQIELGKRNVGTDTLQKHCEALGLEFKEFVKKYCRKSSDIELPLVLNKKLARVVGYFLGDGSFGRWRLNFHEGSKEVVKFYKGLLEETFDCNVTVNFRPDKNYYRLRAYGRSLPEMIKNEFHEIKSSRKSKIPTKILKSENEIVKAFLKGLYDAEGYISRGRVGLGLNNKHLIRQLQLVLLRFSIISSFYEYDNKVNPYSKNNRYTIDISGGKSLKLFKDHIGFESEEKQAKLDESVQRRKSRSNIRQIVESGKNVRETIENHGFNLQKFTKVNDFFRNEKMMSKVVFRDSILSEISDESLSKELEEVLDQQTLPTKISNIEMEKGRELVDISTERENFFVNGLLVHNSAARFERVREGLKEDYFKDVAERIKKIFDLEELKGLIVGGPGPIKENFVNDDYLSKKVEDKIITIKNTSYTGEQGFEELLKRSKEELRETALEEERKAVEEVFNRLREDGKVAYGLDHVMKALELGAAEKLLVSEKLDRRYGRIECECGYEGEEVVKEGEEVICPECGKEVKLKEERDFFDALEDKAKNTGAEIELISSSVDRLLNQISIVFLFILLMIRTFN